MNFDFSLVRFEEEMVECTEFGQQNIRFGYDLLKMSYIDNATLTTHFKMIMYFLFKKRNISKRYLPSIAPCKVMRSTNQ